MKKTLYRNLKRMPIDKYNKYLEEQKNGYITIREHPEDNNVIILNYTPLTVVERRWNNETMTARGLILDITNIKNNDIIILSKPFDKFFNYGENLEYEKDISFKDIESVMEKMDGSLGISYFFNDEIRFATRGSFESEQAIEANKIWKEKYEKYENMEHYIFHPVTYLVEIIYPNNRVVVNYDKRRNLTLLGVNFLNEEIEIDVDYTHLKWEAKRLHMPIAKQFKYNIDTMLYMKKHITANEEGWVLKFKNGKRLKIKGDKYLDVHRAVYGLSDKAKVKAWSEDSIDELIELMPEEFRSEIEELSNSLDRIAETIYKTITLIYQYAESVSRTRKDFALYVNSKVEKEHRKFLFDAYINKKVSIDLIKEHIYKNYKHYLEVV